MRVVIQRVLAASVEVKGKVEGSIGNGLLLLLGIENEDDQTDVTWLVNKVLRSKPGDKLLTKVDFPTPLWPENILTLASIFVLIAANVSTSLATTSKHS